MPSNKTRNAFYYFMQDWKKQEEKKGRLFKNGLKDVQTDPKMNEAWRNLSDNEKLVYKEKEMKDKIQPQPNRKTNLGESVEEIIQIQIREKLFIDRMRGYISCVVNEAKNNKALHKSKFYVIHVNYYCIYECDTPFKYCPAEIGLAEFSLEKGVTRCYSKIINSEIRKGYAYEVKEHSKNTHQIPKEPDFGEKNYGQIFKEIYEFVKPKNVTERTPPLFTLFNDERVKNSVISVLDFLASFNQDYNENFVVYSFEELFVTLFNVNLEDNSYNPMDGIIVSIHLKKDPFDYKSSLCCDYHKNCPGGNFCSTSIVQRWIFTLFSHVCSLLKINLIPGYHVPLDHSLSDEEPELNRSFAALNFDGGACAGQASSPHWSTSNAIKSPSERTYRDEQARRTQSKPLNVTYHGTFKRDSTNSSIPSQEQVAFSASSSSSSEYSQPARSAQIDITENNFPAIGRGAIIKRYQQKKSPKIGYASCFK